MSKETCCQQEGEGKRGVLFGSGGRFKDDRTDPIMERFNESLSFDRRMHNQDIRGSIAYAKANVMTGILTQDECNIIVDGLKKVGEEWNNKTFVIKPGDEDIHTANERRLTEVVGSVGGKLHTGRSRNDQVATDTRLWILDEISTKVLKGIRELLLAGIQHAEENIDILMAGYTHLQPAQPIRYSHWMLSHLVPIMRDYERLYEIYNRTKKQCPLGCGAIAGNAFNIDRHYIAQQLQFDDVTINSIDTVCDRDYILEFLQWSTIIHIHLSQFAEDIIIQNILKTVNIADAYSTGSSLMPQKKNPDALELLRGKAGTVLGRSVGFATTLKGLPRAYNKDLQEDKVQLFNAVDTVMDCIFITTGILRTMKVDQQKCYQTLCPEMLATDLADYLVRERGVPFRETHHISGAVVRYAEDHNTTIDKLTLQQLQEIDSRFDNQDVMKVWDYNTSVERKQSIGGTSKESVIKQIELIRNYVTHKQDSK